MMHTKHMMKEKDMKKIMKKMMSLRDMPKKKKRK